MTDNLISFHVRCDAVVGQGVDKILVVMTDAETVPEEHMILNINRQRGVMKIGANYLITIARLNEVQERQLEERET